MMNRKEMMRLLLIQAQSNGFDLRRWFLSNVRSSWPGFDEALSLLSAEGRHFTLLFSHEFAQCFWCTGAQISFSVPSITYPRVNAQGEVIQVTRKPFTRRTIKPDVWKYHLRQMAISDDPVDYLCRFLPAQQQTVLQQSRQPHIAMAAQG